MLNSIFGKTLLDQRKALIWWSVGTILYLLMLGAFYPSIADLEEQLNELIGAYPEALMAMFGSAGGDLFSPAGFLQSQAFGWLVPLVFAIFAAAMGARAIAGEEEANTIDLLLATPTPRWRVVVEKFGAMAVSLGVLGVALLVGLAICRLFQIDIAFGNMVAVTLSAVLLGLFFGSVALAASATSGRRGLSLGVMAGLAVATYLLYSLGGLVESLDQWLWLSPFYYYDRNQPLVKGLDLGHAAVLLGAAVAALGVAVVTFRRRDVAVG